MTGWVHSNWTDAILWRSLLLLLLLSLFNDSSHISSTQFHPLENKCNMHFYNFEERLDMEINILIENVSCFLNSEEDKWLNINFWRQVPSDNKREGFLSFRGRFLASSLYFFGLLHKWHFNIIEYNLPSQTFFSTMELGF